MDVESYTHYQECMKKPLCPGLVLMESHNGMDLASNLFAMARYISGCAQLSSLRLQITCLPQNEEWMRQRCAEHGIRAERFVIRESPAYFEALAGAEYLISDAGEITRRCNGRTGTHKLSDFKTALETPELLMLFVNRSGWLAFRRSAFADIKDYQKFMDLIQKSGICLIRWENDRSK